MPTDNHQRTQEALDHIATLPGVLGAVIVSRDGFFLLASRGLVPRLETFSAMAAAMVGAAEAALEEAQAGDVQRVIVESARARLVALGFTRELFVVTVIEPSVRLQDVLPRVEEAVKHVSVVVTG